MNLYVYKYNNYYNRIVKKEENLQDYGEPVYSLPSVLNFNFGDGVNTTQTLNTNAKGDYVVLTKYDNLGNEIIDSRWFIVENKYQRNGQWTLSLRRDLVADNYNEIINAPAFIEKATVNANDPAIFNNENMTFNQIKTSETLLQDKTKSAWVVGYVPKDSFKETTTITTDVVMDGIQDITVNSLSELPFSQYINNYNYTGEPYNIRYNTRIKGFDADDSGTYIDYHYGNYYYFPNTDTSTCEKTDVNDSEYNNAKCLIWGTGLIDNSYFTDFASKVLYSFYKDYNKGMIAQVKSLVGSSTDISVEDIEAYSGKIVYDKQTQLFYRIGINKITSKKSFNVNSTSAMVVDYWEPMLQKSPYGKPTTGINYTGDKTNAYTVDCEVYNYSISLDQLAISSSVTIDNDRYHLEDQPFDMFCIPYSDTLPVYKNGIKLFNANKSLAVGIATAIGANAGSATVYDVQLLPYCPISTIQQDESIDIGNNKVDYITQNDVNVGVVLWATASSFTVNIDKKIEVKDYKLTNECDMYRLVSPNYNGQFEFNPAKNNGVTGFTASCTYKPYSPYIKVAPIFNRLYGQDFKDARGLICQGDFSLPQVSNAWANYQLSNKNYEAIFNREITNMEINNKYQSIQTLVGGIAGAGSGAIAGAALGGVGGAIAGGALSLIGAGADYAIQKTLQNEALDYKKDMYGYQLGNIKAMPSSLSKTSAINADNKVFPIIEYYTCTEQEKQALKDKIKYNGMTVGRIGKIASYIQPDYSYIKAQLIRLEGITDDTNYLNEIANEVNKGVFIK